MSLHHILHTVSAGHTCRLVPQMSVWARGAKFSFEIYMQGKKSTSAGQHLLIHAQKSSMTRVSQCFQKLVPGCPWWSPEHRPTQPGREENWGTVFTWWAVITIQKHKTQALVRAKTGIEKTMRCEATEWFLTLRTAPTEIIRDPQKPLVFGWQHARVGSAPTTG